MSTELTTIEAPPEPVRHLPAVTYETGFDLSVYQETAKIAELACKSSLLPVHLQNKPADCLLVFMQAHRWKMDPFAVAQCTSVHQGKLMYEGKVVHAALLANGGLAKPFDYEYEGAGDSRTCTIVGVMPSGEEKRLKVELRKVRTKGVRRDGSTFQNAWDTQPDQMLAYRGARDWARLYAPGIMLGVVTSDEELPERAPRIVTGITEPTDPFTTIDEPPPAAWQEFHPDGWGDAASPEDDGDPLHTRTEDDLFALWKRHPDNAPLCAWGLGWITRGLKEIDFEYEQIRARSKGDLPENPEDMTPAQLMRCAVFVQKKLAAQAEREGAAA